MATTTTVRFATDTTPSSIKRTLPQSSAPRPSPRGAAAVESFFADSQAGAAPLELSLSRLSLPTLSSARNTKSNEVPVPAALEELKKLTPRQRIKKEFALKHQAVHHQRPSSLFGREYEQEIRKREALSSRQGAVSQQAAEKKKRDEEFMDLRLSRSALALNQSMAVLSGMEEKIPDPKLARPSPWVNNNNGSNRHLFQTCTSNHFHEGAIVMPAVPDRWQGPGVGAYGKSTSFLKLEVPRGL